MRFFKYISVIVLIFAIRVSYSQSINIYFKTDSFAVTQSSATQLIDFLNRNRDSNNKYRFEIIGRTDSEGNPEYNKQLSFKRANSTKSFLVSKGIDTTNLILTGYGEYKPIANNSNEEGKAQNRCVTVNITKWSERLSHLLDDSLKVEEFDFHTKNGYTKKLNDCCSITFKPFALADSLGKEINGNIKLRVTYYNNAIDMIKSNITMQAKIGSMDIAYKSHLMFTIEAFYNKKPLKTVYENYVSLDCGCAEMLKNSSVFTFNDGKWEVIEKPKKVISPIAEIKTGGSSGKNEVKEQIEEEKKTNKLTDTPPVTITPPGSKNGGGNSNNCGFLIPCACVDYLAGESYKGKVVFPREEWYTSIEDKTIRWGFPNMYPNHIDSIIDFNSRYNDFNFSRKGYFAPHMIESIDLSIKLSIQEKGFFKKKKYLKIKSGDINNFPELAPIKKQLWKVQKDDFIYSDKELKKMKFSDFRIIKEEKNYILELKAKNDFIKIKLSPDEKEITEPFTKYQNELNKLSKKVTDSLSKRLQNLDNNYLKSWCEVRHCYKILFPELEPEMPLNDWRKYVYENKDKFYSTLIRLHNQKAMAKLKFCDTIEYIGTPKSPGNAVGLGTLNVDEVIEIKDTLQQVKYFLENGQEAYVKQVYVFNKTNRTIVNVENPNQFKCNFNDKSNIILLLDYKDRQFFLNENKPIVTKNNITHIKLIESPGSLEQFKKIVQSSK